MKIPIVPQIFQHMGFPDFFFVEDVAQFSSNTVIIYIFAILKSSFKSFASFKIGCLLFLSLLVSRDSVYHVYKLFTDYYG